ncbi:MAG: hypothetical protein WKF57_08790 [Nakamurella sp.]
MELLSSTGTSLTPTIDGYQFPEITGAGDLGELDDANWLIVAGRVKAADREWKFRDPCLLTGEARWISEWFRAVAEGTMPPTPIAEPDYENQDMLNFLEPNLGFSYESRVDEEVLIRAHLSLEALPTDLDEEVDLHEYSVDLVLTRARVAAAVEVWDEERRAYPARGWSPRRTPPTFPRPAAADRLSALRGKQRPRPGWGHGAH